MREIKFRGIQPWNGKVGNVVVIDWLLDEVFFENSTDIGYPIEQCKLKQYTGLKDCNGVEVYEGGIVSNEAFICNLEVYYAEELGMFRFGVDQDDYGDFIEYQSHDFKVIGDIDENPELLNAR